MDNVRQINRRPVTPTRRLLVDEFVHSGPPQKVLAPKLVTGRPVERSKGAVNPVEFTPTREALLEAVRVYPAYIPPRRPLRPLKRHRVRKWIMRSFSLLLALFLSTGGFLTWKGYSNVHKVFQGTSTVAALSKDIDPVLLHHEGDSRVNILLLGVGGPAHDGPDLTDTMLLLSVDPVNNTAALVSIPRDLWVKMPVNYFGQYQKINAVYESGKYHYLGHQDDSNSNKQALNAGFAAADQAVETVLGVRIDYHVLVDFQAFRQAVDAVDGVTIDVAEPLYDPTMAWENNNNPVLAPAGVQAMNGKEALLYARSRETSSDFARTQRQRQLLLALKDKVLSLGTLSNPTKISGLLDSFGDNVYTDISIQGAERLYSIMRQVNNSSIASIGLADPPNNYVTTDHVGNISVVRPRAGFDDYSQIQAYIQSQLPDGYVIKEHAPIVVLSASGSDGTAATTLTHTLQEYGYKATVGGSTSASSSVTLVDLSHGRAPYSKHYLEQRLGVQAVEHFGGLPKLPSGTEFAIIVNNYEGTAN